MTTLGSTLAEELEQAAKRAGQLCDQLHGYGETKGCQLVGVCALTGEVASLRARAARIRELLDLVHAQKFNGGRRELARALTGPLSPTGPSGGETKET